MTRVAPLAVLARRRAGRSRRAVDARPGAATRAEVVVLLESPPLARAPGTGASDRRRAARVPTRARSSDPGRRNRLALPARRERLLAHASVTQVARLRALPGVRDVLPAASYEPQLTSSPQQIGAPALWGPDARHRRSGREDRDHRLGHRSRAPVLRSDRLRHAGRLPEGSAALHDCEGDRRARVRAKERDGGERARGLRDDDSSHGTHVAGIAAGQRRDERRRRRVSGVAPRAYLGNYKVFVQTSSGLSPNANSPAIVAAIEAAVADGMDVINFSGGEPEIEPSRDIVALGARRGRSGGRRAGRRRRERLQRPRRGLRVVTGQLGPRDRGRRRRDRRESHDADACGVLVRRPDDRSRSASSRTSPRPASMCCRRSRVAAGRSSPARAWRRHTSRARRRCCASAIRRGPSSSSKSALVQSGVDSALSGEP